MRTYTIDELSTEEIGKVVERLRAMGLEASLEGVFWMPVPDNMLTTTQQTHQGSCGPYSLALEVTDDALHLELLVRAANKLRCECLAFASESLRNHMINYVERLLVDSKAI